MIMIMTKLLNVRTVAKAMGGRISGQRGVRGLASEKKVRIGLSFFWLYFSRKVCEDVQRKTIQDVQVGFGGTHPPQCLSSWKGEGSSIWSVSQIAAFNIDNVWHNSQDCHCQRTPISQTILLMIGLTKNI